MTISVVTFILWLGIAFLVGRISGVWAMYRDVIPIMEKHEKECSARGK